MEFNAQEKALLEEADRLTQEAVEKRQRAIELRHARWQKLPLANRLLYAATARCTCGAGLAYDESTGTAKQWECSRVLLGEAQQESGHIEPLPFAFYEIKSEGQPSAQGATTRPS